MDSKRSFTLRTRVYRSVNSAWINRPGVWPSQSHRLFIGMHNNNNTHTHIHTHTQPFNGLWSGTTRVGRYPKKTFPHSHPSWSMIRMGVSGGMPSSMRIPISDHRASFINFLHLLRSTASSLFNLRAWQSFSTTSLQVLFCLPLGLGPSRPTLYSIILHKAENFREIKGITRELCSIIIAYESLKNYKESLIGKGLMFFFFYGC